MNKKKLAFFLLALSNISVALAGGILTNTNQTAHFARNMARDASLNIDAAYTNPAGLVMLRDGLHFSYNNQSVFQTRTITSTFAPFVGNGGFATKSFEGKASAPIVPNLQAAYKKGPWVLSANFAVSGGGGKATFNKGLPSFESAISTIPPALTALGIATTSYSVEQYMTGSSFIYGAQMGGSYKINNTFSAYGGFRLNIVNNGYEGHLKNILINPVFAGNPTGAMISAPAFFTAIGNTALAASTKDKYLDSKQSGWGIAPILGVNINQGKWNVGMKYEFKTALDVESKTTIDDTGLYADGVNTPHDIPALLTVGVAYKILPQLTASVGYHHFFDSDAKMANNKQQFVNNGTNEYLVGIEYQINRLFLVSGGAQITNYSVEDGFQSDLSFSLNSHSVGFGGAVNLSKSTKLNVGYFWTTYSDWTKDKGIAGRDVFARTNKVFAVGVDFSF